MSVTTKSGKKVKIRAACVGTNFCGQVVAGNGRVIAETDVVPFREAALERAEALAQKL